MATLIKSSNNNSNKSSSSNKSKNNNDEMRNAPIEALMETAAQVVRDACNDSTIFQNQKDGTAVEDKFPKFHEREVVAGQVIGRGGFCVVRNVDKLRCNGVSTRRLSSNDNLNSSFSALDPSVTGRSLLPSASKCIPWLCNSSRSLGGSGGPTTGLGGSERGPRRGTRASSSIFDESSRTITSKRGQQEQKERRRNTSANNGRYGYNTDGSLRGMEESSRHRRRGSLLSFGTMDDDEMFDDEEIRLTRDYVASMSRKRNKQNKSRYVIKTVATNVDKITYMKGCVDIVMECKFLSTLDHPNIIRLVAVSSSKPCTPGYFLILERMKETLTQRIKSWMDTDRQNKSLVLGAWLGGKQKELKLYQKQISAAYDIAEALYYLHCRKIIFRDLKPDNIGFDSYDTLKLFDFGLAKELLEKDRVPSDPNNKKKNYPELYRLTKCTGALRYMAPEVGLGKPYNQTADVYSFSMLFWYMLALEPPFGMYSNKMIYERVFQGNNRHGNGFGGSRPAIFKRWKEMIVDILKSCWDENIANRPSFLEISLCLKQELIDCESDCNGKNKKQRNAAGKAESATASYHGGDECLNELSQRHESGASVQ